MSVYEGLAHRWFEDHPYLHDQELELRNAVFSAVAVARCACSKIPEYQDLAYEYSRLKKPTYLLLYVLHELAKDNVISARFFNLVVQSCSELIGTEADVTIDIDGSSWDEVESEQDKTAQLVVELRLTHNQIKAKRIFCF